MRGRMTVHLLTVETPVDCIFSPSCSEKLILAKDFRANATGKNGIRNTRIAPNLWSPKLTMTNNQRNRRKKTKFSTSADRVAPRAAADPILL